MNDTISFSNIKLGSLKLFRSEVMTRNSRSAGYLQKDTSSVGTFARSKEMHSKMHVEIAGRDAGARSSTGECCD